MKLHIWEKIGLGLFTTLAIILGIVWGTDLIMEPERFGYTVIAGACLFPNGLAFILRGREKRRRNKT